MWTCRACGLSVMFRAVVPEVDEEGIFFLCMGCGHRNTLERDLRDAEGLTLFQPNE